MKEIIENKTVVRIVGGAYTGLYGRVIDSCESYKNNLVRGYTYDVNLYETENLAKQDVCGDVVRHNHVLFEDKIEPVILSNEKYFVYFVGGGGSIEEHSLISEVEESIQSYIDDGYSFSSITVVKGKQLEIEPPIKVKVIEG